MIPTLIGISIIIFLMVRLLPGDIIDVLLGGDQGAKESSQAAGARAARSHRLVSGAVLALDQRLPPRRLRFSYRNTQPVSEILLNALPITLELVLLGLLIAVVIGLPLGVLSAVKRDSKPTMRPASAA